MARDVVSDQSLLVTVVVGIELVIDPGRDSLGSVSHCEGVGVVLREGMRLVVEVFLLECE